VERMSRDLISHDPNRGMASRAADSRWDRWVLTKWAATGRGKDEAFAGRGGVKGQRWEDGAEEGEEVVRGKSMSRHCGAERRSRPAT